MKQSNAFRQALSVQGVGIGLRFPHMERILAERPAIAWLEVLSDNFLLPDTLQQSYLQDLVGLYPLCLHGVGLSLGSIDPLNQQYLKLLAELIAWTKPVSVSDHLCWTGAHGWVSHELLPLPYNHSTLHYVADRIKQVQDYLQRRLVIENVSSYMQYHASTMPEWEFLAALVELADCDILLDINNIYVNAYNHRFDPETYWQAIPKQRVGEMHLAGHEDKGTHLLDTHSRPVSEAVWALYTKAIQHFGVIPTLIEWDNDLPSLEQLLAEAAKAQAVQDATS